MTQTPQLWNEAKVWSRTERQCKDSLKMQASSVSLLNIETTHFSRSPLALRHRDVHSSIRRNCETSWLFLTSRYKCVFTCKASSGAHFLLVFVCCVLYFPTPDRWEGTFFWRILTHFGGMSRLTFFLFCWVDSIRRFVCCSCLLIRQKQEGYWYSCLNPSRENKHSFWNVVLFSLKLQSVRIKVRKWTLISVIMGFVCVR